LGGHTARKENKFIQKLRGKSCWKGRWKVNIKLCLKEIDFSNVGWIDEKTKYMIMSRHPNTGQNQNNESFEKVAKFKYLGTTLTNQNDFHN